ncbi:MAG: HAMP domain-containing protein [Lewinellaceae bacterium]|nr:HAMP domain-containing protein [Lewinellaceae bacterium]
MVQELRSTMTLQTQIRLGLLFLLVLLAITGGAGIYFLIHSGQDATGMEAIALLCLILAGDFLINFPLIVARRLRNLADAAREIAGGQFDRRIIETRHDEFGEIANSVNALAAAIEAQKAQNSPQTGTGRTSATSISIGAAKLCPA